MYFTSGVLALLAATTAVAAPLTSRDTTWTIEGMHRPCNSDNTQCTWEFSINNGAGQVTACTMVVNGANASELNGGPATCGDYTVTSGWSGQFGPGQGFTTLAVKDATDIIWPAYTDTELANGKTAVDKSYTPQPL